MATLNTEQWSASEKEEVKEKLRQQLALVNAQELLSKMTRKCFTKCIEMPGNSLTSYEQKCLAMCMDRFMDSWQLVSKTYYSRIAKEKHKL